jgi:hypothetical protein
VSLIIDHGPKIHCVHHEHVPYWTLTRLKLQNTYEVREMMYDSDEEIEAGTRGEWIAKNLCPCDNIVVPTNIDEPFWLMLVDKGPHSILESFKDNDQNEWTIGDVVQGYWYQRLEANS